MTVDSVVMAPRRLGIEARAALFAIGCAAAGAVFSWEHYVTLLKQYSVTHFFALPPMLAVGLLAAAFVVAPGAPLSWILNIIRQRGVSAAATVAIFCLFITAFSTFKHHLPAWLPFFADKPLAALDAMLHFGQPWRWTHTIAPDGAAPILAFLYGPVWFTQWLGMVLFAAFLPNDRLRIRYLIAFIGSMFLLGFVVRAAGASAGPIFYDRMFGGERFGDMMSALSANPFSAQMLAASDYLYSAYLSDEAVFGTGISAMPSIHVAMAVLNALFLSSLNRWLGFAGWIFAAAIMFGSVYFGWHYALDGYVSLIGVVLIWRWATRLTFESF